MELLNFIKYFVWNMNELKDGLYKSEAGVYKISLSKAYSNEISFNENTRVLEVNHVFKDRIIYIRYFSLTWHFMRHESDDDQEADIKTLKLLQGLDGKTHKKIGKLVVSYLTTLCRGEKDGIKEKEIDDRMRNINKFFHLYSECNQRLKAITETERRRAIVWINEQEKFTLTDFFKHADAITSNQQDAIFRIVFYAMKNNYVQKIWKGTYIVVNKIPFDFKYSTPKIIKK